MTRVLILGHDDVVTALPPDQCASAMADVLAGHARGESYFPLRPVMAPPDASGFMGLMPGWRASDGANRRSAAFGLKAICVIPTNPARGLDTHQGTVTLFDGSTGRPRAILDASAITAVRTAAVSAVATRTLAREDARVLTILGAGVQGRAHLRALPAVRAFDEVRVYAPSREHARALADGHAVVASSAEEAVRGADVVVLATTSPEPVIAREWLSPGAHVNAVGASVPSSRELDVETVAQCALFCDSRESLRHEAGEFRQAVEQGAIGGEDHVRAELGEVLAGMAPGRTDPQELTVFRSLGLAVEDLAAAERAVSLARVLGVGTEVQL
jgi:ornithine cyclodeaminase